MSKRVRSHSLLAYALISYSITTTCWLPAGVIAAQRGYLLPTMDGIGRLLQTSFADATHLVVSVIFFFGVYGPLVAAITVTRIEGGKTSLKEFFGKMMKWRVRGRWYLLLFLLPIAFNLSALGIGALLSGAGGFAINPTYPLVTVISFFFYQVFTSGLEEPGWRGFALPKLQSKYNAGKSSWILGVIWSIWHFPFVAVLFYPMGIIPMALSLIGFTMGLIGQSIIYTWFYNSTRSILIPILYHASLNVSSIYIIGSDANPIVGVLPWVVAVFLLKKYGSETLSSKQRALD